MSKLPQRLTMKKSTGVKPAVLRVVENAASGSTDIYLYDEIGFWGITAQDFVDRLNEVDSKKINLHINSPGGEIFDGLAIFNAIKQHPAEVTVYVDALAASAASFIAQAGDKVIMARNATMMIHDGIGLAYGNEQDMLDTAALLSKLSDNIADIYAFRAGGTVEDWRALMREEVWYSSSEAVEAGLADERLDEDNKEAEEETNKWDFSIFNYAGRDEAPSPGEIRKRVLTNRVKEASMGKTAPKNQDGTQPTEPSETTTGTDGTQTDDTEGTPPEQTTTQPGNEPAPAPEGQPAPEQATPAPAPEQPSNRTGFSVMVNGVATTDVTAIQNHVNALETFRKEAIEQSRRDFVTNLSNRNIIPATQVDKLTNHVLSLTDEQFSAYAEMYSDAQPQPLFQQHGITPGDTNSPASSEARESLMDEISTLEQIVADHRRSGMSQEKLESKESYKRLQTLKSQINNNA